MNSSTSTPSRVTPALQPDPHLHRREWMLWVFMALLLAVALFGPAWHSVDLPMVGAFADARHLGGVPNAMDVWSNLPFALIGVLGLWRLLSTHRRRADAGRSSVWQACAALFFAGFVCTAIGSSIYHWAPDVWRLAGDRTGMAVAFAGLIGLAVCERVSERSALPAAIAVLLAGALAAVLGALQDNLLPWVLVQFGGMALVLAAAFAAPRRGPAPIHLSAVIALYVLAKLFEWGDHAIFEATGEIVSGHTLKHLVAALTGWVVLRATGPLPSRSTQSNAAPSP